MCVSGGRGIGKGVQLWTSEHETFSVTSLDQVTAVAQVRCGLPGFSSAAYSL